jgi:UDP-glucuronate decarboxylase
MIEQAPIPSLREFLDLDLDYVCGNLQRELGRLAGRRVLLTGGAGFLGYYFVLTALHWNQSHDRESAIRMTVYDNYIRGVPSWLEELRREPHLTLVRQDMIQPLPAGIPDFQYIIHAAGIASPIYYRRYPIQTIDANINGLRNLLDYSLRQRDAGKPVEGFLFFSSSEIYGDPSPDKIPTAEDYRGNVSCTGPRACYDESKRFGETLCVNFARQYELPVKMVRPFNNYGPGLKISDRRALPDFARDVLAGRDVRMLSDGAPKRTFCYSADAITGYYKILVCGHPAEAYNIGVERPEVSMLEAAEKVVETARRLLGYRGRVVRAVSEDKEYLVDNPNRRCPRIDKARAHLGYDPRILFDEGIKRALIWYHYHREAEDA